MLCANIDECQCSVQMNLNPNWYSTRENIPWKKIFHEKRLLNWVRHSSSSLFSGDDIAEDIADVDDAIDDASDDDIDSLCTSDHNLASFDDGDECEVHQVSSFS